ncbi:hypothetical protein GCM10007972_01970 [Iodidimonas muriae]|uniref:Uncharacterized protein n=1 Tax=Iodidimonas muriae TaxID=261467 RepID=A0ABQ2L6F4_9PROT|nr:hypothetical protein JCM17843_08050 [Kordiimonadales bacterium JCM 17843]GGO05008.1 hypothetical protein GCM10007972_01970 [Iodidimonas muriae]
MYRERFISSAKGGISSTVARGAADMEAISRTNRGPFGPTGKEADNFGGAAKGPVIGSARG